MKRVMITGIGGFVGAHLLAHIMKNTDWEVVGIDSFRHKGKTDRVADLLRSYPDYRRRLHIFTHDLVAPISVQLASAIGRLDYLFSVASESHVDRSITDPRPFIENNVGLMLTLLDYIREHPVKHFIQISTDEVYGPAELVDHPEGDPHRPSNPYAASKAAQEDICYSYWRTYGLPITIVNIMNMLGEMQDVEKFIPKTIRGLQNGEPLTVHVAPDGTPGSRYYLHARNTADALLFLVEKRATLYPASDIDRFNVVSQDEINNLEMVAMIAEIMMAGEPNVVRQNFHESRPGHDLRYGLDGKKLRGLGWKPPVPFREGLDKTVAWTLEHPEWIA